MVEEEQHILRYWEKEFPQLSPKKNRGGNRIYSPKDIALIREIKSMLRDGKLSLKGAKERIAGKYSAPSALKPLKMVKEPRESLQPMLPLISNDDYQALSRKELTELRNLLSDALEFTKNSLGI